MARSYIHKIRDERLGKFAPAQTRIMHGRGIKYWENDLKLR